MGRDDDVNPADDDEEEPFLESIRAKWSMDGAVTLSEAAEKLREHATWLEELERDGWQLIDPIDDDWGFITNPDPAKHLSVVVEVNDHPSDAGGT